MFALFLANLGSEFEDFIWSLLNLLNRRFLSSSERTQEGFIPASKHFLNLEIIEKLIKVLINTPKNPIFVDILS